MTAKELLLPRFEVIAEYPKCNFEKGTILTQINDLEDWYHDNLQSDIIKGVFIKPYPHLFKPLNWWEHRTVEQMPKRVLSLAIEGETEKVIEIESWDMSNFNGWVNKKERTCVSLTAWKPEFGYLPID